MKQLLVFAIAMVSVSSWALDALPSGAWSGSGQFKSQSGERGSYQSRIEIKGDTITGTAEINGKKISHSAKIRFERDGFFTATADNGKTATGYCVRDWCHLDNADRSYEMTFGWDGNEMYTMGSLTRNGKRTVYSDKLNRED